VIRLTLEESGWEDRPFELDGELITIGRAPSNHVQVNDPRISGRHGQISARDGRYFFRDLLSTNGSMLDRGGTRTVLDGKVVAEIEIHEGDLLLLGDVAEPVRLRVTTLTPPGPSKHSSETIIAKRSVAAANQLPSVSPEDATGLRGIFTLLKDLNSHLEVQEIYTRVADYLLAVLTSATHVSVLGVDADALDVEFVRSRPGRDPGDAPRSRSILRQVVEKKETILFQDLEGALATSESLVGARLRSAVCAPLLHDEQVIGVLQVAAVGSAQQFSQRALDVLAVIAYQVGTILENARLFRRVTEMQERLKDENVYLREKVRGDASQRLLIGESASMKRIHKQIDLVAATDTTVLVLGETGTGKELVARSVHESSPRREGLFGAVNCGALAPTLLESELFGHVKGSFTGAVKDKKGLFEISDGGTLFLDEIGEIAPNLQVKLLRALQEGEVQPVGAVRPKRVNVRIVAATNRDLAKEVEKGTFRQDLFYRINVFPIVLPPLRERRDDIARLCEHFVALYAKKMNKRVAPFTAEASDRLRNYAWPGNVRELQNEMERAVLLAPDGGPIGIEELSEKLQQEEEVELTEITGPTGPQGGGKTLKETLAEYEEQVIRRALEENAWNRARTAKFLGISRQAFMTKLSKMNIRKTPS
jgi:Nif-specific regulatory protein